MAKKENQHIVDKQTINLEIAGISTDKEVQDVQEQLLYFYRTHLGESLDKILTKICPPDLDILIDDLTIDITDIQFSSSRNLEEQLHSQFQKAIANAVSDKIKRLLLQNRTSSGGTNQHKFSKAAILEFFFVNGYTPTWASKENGSIDAIFEELVKHKPQQLLRRLFKIGKHSHVQERLFQQISDKNLERLFDILYGQQKEVVRKRLAALYKKLDAKSRKAILSAAINYILMGKSPETVRNAIKQKDNSFIQHIVQEVQKHKAPIDTPTNVRPGFEGSYSDIQILEYFLEHGAIPSWADVDSQQTFQKLFDTLLNQDLAKVHRLIERQATNDVFIRRLIFQFSTTQLLRLFINTPDSNLRFIEKTIEELSFLSVARQKIPQTISKEQIRAVVLSEALDYFFLYKKSKFIKQTFIQNILEELAPKVQTTQTVLVKESYKYLRRKQQTTVLRPVLERLDDKIKESLAEERAELKAAKQEYKQIEKELEKLQTKLEKGEKLSKLEQDTLKKLQAAFRKVEQVIAELDHPDKPLEIELLLEKRTAIKQQLQLAKEQDRTLLEARLQRTERTFEQLRQTLSKEVETLLKNKAKLHTKTGSIAEQRIKRINNRIGKYHRAIKNVLQQLLADQQDIGLVLDEIRRALRTPLSAEEKRQLREERKRLQERYEQIRTVIEELEAHQKELETTLQSAVSAAEGEEEGIQKGGTSKLQALLFMLQYGATPWWAEDLPKQSIEDLFLEFSAQEPQKLRSAFLQVGKYPVVWERTINQLSNESIELVINRLFPNNARAIFAQAKVLETIHYSQGFSQLRSVNAKAFKWGIILEYLLTSKQSISHQVFSKEILLQTARFYQLSPKKLVEFTHNVIQNSNEQLNIALDWDSSILKEDQQLLALEKELVVNARRQHKKSEGTWLEPHQKLELLASFMTTGKIDTQAKSFKYNTIEDFEDLLLELIQKDRDKTREVVVTLLKTANARSLLISEFSAESFWEVVFLIRPKALLPVQRYFKDFKVIFKDKNLYEEKEILLNVFLGQPQAHFDPKEYIRVLLMRKMQSSNRQPLAILGEWKRQTSTIGSSLKSSWLITIIAMEVEVIKHEQEQSSNAEVKQSLQKQLEALAKDYTEASQMIREALFQENAEIQSDINRRYTLEEVERLILQTVQAIEALKEQLKTADTLTSITGKQQLAQYEARLKLLKQQRPPLIRKLERQIEELKASTPDLGAEIEEERQKLPPLEEESVEESYVASLIERQNEFLNLIERAPNVAIGLLTPLLEELKKEGRFFHAFIKAVDTAVQELNNAIVKTQLTTILANYSSQRSLPSVRKLQQSIELDERQRALVAQIPLLAPFMLWQEWEKLEAYYAANPALKTTERERLQAQIYAQLQFKDEQNILAYIEMMHTARVNIEQAIEQASSLEVLTELQDQLEQLWEQQRQQGDELIAIARDEKNRNYFKRIKRNIEFIFTKLQNKRIRRSNQLITAQLDELTDTQTQHAVQLDELEQRKTIVIEEIERDEAPEETPVEEAPVKKKKRKKGPKPRVVEEPLRVYNAGMVLLWPYFSRLFTFLKYVKDKEFVNEEAQHKAIHILQYLVTGKTEAPENELVLNKLFCGVPTVEPVPFGIEFDPGELKMADNLLTAAIKAWPKMKTMHPNALRGSFLIREGTVKEEPERWVIKVDRKPFDILLKSIPWGYNFIKLPWVEKMIIVEWQLF